MPVVMALKGVDYEYRAVNLIKDGGEQKREEYVRNQNPMGEVPTFVDGDTVLTQVQDYSTVKGLCHLAKNVKNLANFSKFPSKMCSNWPDSPHFLSFVFNFTFLL